MNSTKAIKSVILACVLLILAGNAAAQTLVRADIDGDIFNVGDQIKLTVLLEGNPGMHGLFFDMAYDGSVLAFESLEEGLLIQRVTEQADLYYAHSDPLTSSSAGSHVIVSYALRGSDTESKETGALVELYFRVIDPGTPETAYRFIFNNYAIKDKDGLDIAGVQWENSIEFTIGSPVGDGYIVISSPYDNQVFYGDEAPVNAIFTGHAGYTVRLSNIDTGYASDPISAAGGSLTGELIPLQYGFNRIEAALFDGDQNILATDKVVVYRSEDTRFIRIIKPADHALLNTNLANVIIASDFAGVMVNGVSAQALGEKYGEMDLYQCRVWLKRGFNTITAQTENPQGAIYKDTIVVYYEQSDTIFRFITPLAGEVFKSAQGANLQIKGEISSLYKTPSGADGQGAELNTVTIKVIYYPDNPLYSTRILVDNKLAVIEETDVAQDQSSVPYMFSNNFEIALQGMDTGEIEIIAYKNKEGNTWENEIHRYVYVDSSRLWINLVQPNIYTSDILDTPYKLSFFHNPDETEDPLAGSNIQLTNDGSFKLKAIDNIVNEETEFSNINKKVSDIIETDEGSVFALVNENNALKIYEKEYGAASWVLRVSRPDMYGYDICETDIGILVGVSNLFSSEDSGLYILQGTILTNIVIGQPIPHVQFIKNHNGTIYLYGNDYSHLYSFNLYTLEDDAGRLKTSVVKKEEFSNNLFITQFELSSDAYTALIRTSDGRVRFFQKVLSAGYREVSFDSDIFDPATEFTQVIVGEYNSGDYNTYLLIKQGVSDNSAFIVMENKISHRLIPSEIQLNFAPGESLLGADFKGDEFLFIHRVDGSDSYHLRKGQILFNYMNIQLVTDGVEEAPYQAESGVDIAAQNLKVYKTSHDSFYLGFGENLTATKLYCFTSDYPSSAQAAFNYKNYDIEGLSGFSFEVDTKELSSSNIEIGFTVREEDGSPVTPAVAQPLVSLQNFMETESDYFSVEKQYDAGIRKEIVYVTFTNLQENNRYLSFNVRIHAVGNISPTVSNMTVYKKVPVKLPRSAGEYTYLPIHGFVYDPTVEEVYIQEIKLALDRDGSFTYNYRINSTESKVPVEIYCINGAGETATLKFNVELFESVNGLANIVIADTQNIPIIPENGNEHQTNESKILVSGDYYGLAGTNVGYELYTYDYSQGTEKLVLLHQGVFSKAVDGELDPAYAHLGSGYESGAFYEEVINLTPGKQRLVIYVENPGGVKHEYLIDEVNGLYPEIIFNLAEEDQKIIITNIEKQAITPYGFDGKDVDEKISLQIHETTTEPYLFSRTYVLRGEVLSLYKLTDLKIKSYSSEVKFENGSTEIIVPIDKANRFEVRAIITMPEDCEVRNYHLAFIPTPPFLYYMREILRLEAAKSFADTYMVPDFETYMAASKWTTQEIRAKEKPIRVGISRFIPAGARLNLLVNYEETLSGELVEVNPGQAIYKLVDNSQDLKLTGVKYDNNRVQWRLVTRDGLTISSSTYSKPGMEDFIFYLAEPQDIQSTLISFPVELQVYYDAEGSAVPLPDISITRDPSTQAEVYVNQKLIWNELLSTAPVVDGTVSDTVNVYAGNLIEGLNVVEVTYTEGDDNPVSVEYTFLYDSKSPQVKIIDYKYNADYTKLSSLTALVTEANLSQLTLLQGSATMSEIDIEPVIVYVENDIYKVIWSGILTYNAPLGVFPTPADPVKVEVYDHSGKGPVYAVFNGVSSTMERPDAAAIQAVAINLPVFIQSPYYLDEDGYSYPEHPEFDEHTKFFNSRLTLQNFTVQQGESIVFERHESITVGGTVLVQGDGVSGGILTLRAGEGPDTGVISFQSGFNVKTGGSLVVQNGNLGLANPTDGAFQHAEESEEMSFVFWFRYDQQEYYAADANNFRKVLTLYEKEQPHDGMPAIYTRLYLAYKDDDGMPATGDEYLYLIEEYRDHDLSKPLEDRLKRNIMLGDPLHLPISSAGRPHDWNCIVLSVDTINEAIHLSVNSDEQVSIALTGQYSSILLADYSNVLADIVAQDTEADEYFYFGERPVWDHESGYLSIDQAFYTDRMINYDDLPDVTIPGGSDFVLPEDEPRRVYYFDSSTDNIGPEYFKLRLTGSDAFTDKENVDYDQEGTALEPGGSLKASRAQRNFLKIAADGSVIFHDASKYYQTNLDVVLNTDDNTTIKLIPLYSSGRYFFGNDFGSHDVKNDAYYSVIGEIIAAEQDGQKIPINARLVVRINGKEQSMELQEGRFHFICTNNVTPTSVIMYIEARQPLKFKKDICFIEGNYELPLAPLASLQALDLSYATTKYVFYTEGTIHFWYKPFIVNEQGFTNYETVLFDSEYLRIGTRKLAGNEYVTYYAYIYGEGEDVDPVELYSDVPVHDNWQHIQFSYSLSDNDENDMAYLYIDGKLAAFKEGSSQGFPQHGSMSGQPIVDDNVYIGANKSMSAFAEGYIDSVYFNSVYAGPVYEAIIAEENILTDPLVFSYSDGPPCALTITANGIDDTDIDDITFILSSRDGSFRQVSEPETFESGSAGHGFDIPALLPGPYIVKAEMLLNGRRYQKMYSFTKSDKPRFVLKDVTPLIIVGVESDINFGLGYDDSYLVATDDSIFSGMVVTINYKENEEDKSATLYVTQDYYYLQDKKQWLVFRADDVEPTPLTPDGNCISFSFDDITSSDPISWEMHSFYFDATFDASLLNLDENSLFASGTIPDASMSVNQPVKQIEIGNKIESIEYKLEVSVGSGASSSGKEIFQQLTIGYLVQALDGSGYTASGEFELNADGRVDIYYDDILPGYGKYDCILSIKYQGQSYNSELRLLEWKEISEDFPISETKSLDIIDFSLLHLDRKTGSAQVYLEYRENNIQHDILYELTLISDTSKERQTYNGSLNDFNNPENYIILNIQDIEEGLSYVIIDLRVEDDNIFRNAEFTMYNYATAPEVVLTNSVSSLIGYNNVMFSWRGFHDGVFKPDISYSYNFDNQGWSTPNPEWRSIELFALADGYHNFRVKAVYDGEESPEVSVTFFVDIHKPQFDITKISVQELYDQNNVLYAVKLLGAAGAIEDVSLNALRLNGNSVDFNADGSFVISEIPLFYDGTNEIVLTAVDKVGNFTDYTITVENNITQILFPDLNSVRFAPMTLVGKVNKEINAKMEIYLFDPLSRDTGDDDFSGWKKAVINEDRVFFIEDVYINPGTLLREAVTRLEMAVVFESGKTFRRTLVVRANEIMRPIDMVLSTHAAEGETEETEVSIDCKANVGNISSWSIDFDGDGVYDDVIMVDNTLNGKLKNWTHTYSSIGLVKPRVRIITLDGNYFSVCDSLIIHEKITQSSPVMVNDPISMSVIYLPDGSERLFILAGENNDFRVEVFEIGQTMNYVSDKLFTFSLAGYGIENPVKIKAPDLEHFYIAENRNGRCNVYVFKANQAGNYQLITQSGFQVYDTIRDMDADVSAQMLYLTLANYNIIVTVPLVDKLPVYDQHQEISPEVYNAIPLGGNLSIAKDPAGAMLADFYNQRVIKLTGSLKVESFFGSFGSGEGEFIKPSHISTHANRVFIFDEGRFDIQVFGPEFNIITTIGYNSEPGYENYLEEDFMNDLADIAVVSRDEGGRLYYYLLMLSKSREKLAMLRLPQWEEFRARIRNNKIVFLKEREVYTAKPTGSDLMRIISSDSFPRIEGTLDYPALSPDGKRIVFTSRVELYDGASESAGGSEYAYDNIYVIDVNGENLMRIPMGAIENYLVERPVFNSNGDKIIFSAKTAGGYWQIYTYNFATGGIQQLFSSTENARFPYFSPDDRFVVFTTDYDGDQDIEIVDVENTDIRVMVTNNSARDSYPVWNNLYPYEIANADLDIESKISFVSERNFHKGVWYVYIARPSESDVRVVTKDGDETGNDPDSAALEVTSQEEEGDYPCFTGDGKSLVFEYYDGQSLNLKRYLFEEPDPLLPMNLPAGSRKPAGMKNTIANFQAQAVNGDEVRLSWTPYTDQDTFYFVEFKKNQEGEISTVKKVFTQDGTTIKGLEMGVEYLFRVYIKELQAQAEPDASSQWKVMLMPKVAARPSYEFDAINPYLVKMHAWKPNEETEWRFSWIIDNQEITAGATQDYYYEFATSGQKTILLKASDKNNIYTSISQPMIIDVVSDIHPVIEYVLADDASYIEMDASKTEGSKIDWAATTWIVSGPGAPPTMPTTGSKTIIMLDNFSHKINVNLTLRRIPVTGQPATDVIERNLAVDLDFADVKAVITYEIDEANSRLYRFSGENSLGNIDWFKARWYVYGDGIELHREDSVSSFAYQFPESGIHENYTVSLTVPRMNDGLTETSTIIVNVEPAPIEPVIDYEILTLKEGLNTVGAKILFSCSNSKGSSIDFSQARWSVPVAGGYNEQPTQVGPTAIYNLFGIDENTIVEVSLTLTRRGGTDPTSVTRLINIESGQVAGAELIVNRTVEQGSSGKVLILDVLSSTGPNIDWEKTQWLIDNQYTRYGPLVRIDVPESGENTTITYACTLFRFGDTPLHKVGEVVFDTSKIRPVFSVKKLAGGNGLSFMLDVLDTPGVNIDWERTMWYIFDGNQSTVQKQGAQIMHTFVTQAEAMGYPVMVTMYYKGSTLPFVGYISIDVEGDELIPVITCDIDHEKQDEFVVYFSGEASHGYNLDWTQTKWTFGDSSEAQYGPVVVHKYPLSGAKREYKVSLTITRRLPNGTVETKTAYKTIKLDGDKIKPVIKAALFDDHMVLSAEESQGVGLLLDRSYWLFPGKGDSESYATSQQDGTISTSSYSSEHGWDANVSTNFGLYINNFPVLTVSAGAHGSYSYSTSTQSYNDFINSQASFSTSNAHTGAVCRRTITPEQLADGYIIVTLYVYRMLPDGTVEGESITVKVDLQKATVTADKNGVTYGK